MYAVHFRVSNCAWWLEEIPCSSKVTITPNLLEFSENKGALIFTMALTTISANYFRYERLQTRCFRFEIQRRRTVFKGRSFALTTWNKGESCWSKNKEVAYLNMRVWMTCFSTLQMRCWEILNKMKWDVLVGLPVDFKIQYKCHFHPLTFKTLGVISI